jgi:6-phosphogluconolactonase/glucosamine-6-phosphate isomerase/deaminase
MSYEIKQSFACSHRLVALLSVSTPTLFLISGGSSLSVINEFSEKICTALNHLTIGFVDERFDPQNSNYIQLVKQFPNAVEKTKKLGAVWIDTSPQKKDQYEMASWYEEKLSAVKYERLVILLGMGKDGHIAGIFPDKEDAFTKRFVHTDRFIVGYEAKNEFPKRFTATFSLLKTADHILAYITGEDKRIALTRALYDNPPLHECPAAFFTQDSLSCEVYTDLEKNIS